MIKFILSFVICALFLTPISLHAQHDQFCGQKCKKDLIINKQSSANYGNFTSGGMYLPTKGYIRALAIFVQFKDDFNEDPHWKINSLPDWSNEFSSMITKYFSDMSNGELKIDVDVFPSAVVSDRTQWDYYYDKQNYGHVNKEVLSKVDQSISFLPYDNWYLVDKYNGYPGHDTQVDLVFMIYRSTKVYDLLRFYGVSDLGYGWKLPVDETKRYLWGGNESEHDDASASGVTICKAPGSSVVMDLNSAYRLSVHETIHKMYGEGHPIYSFASLGVLSNAYGSVGMSSFEKAAFGYLNYKKIDSLKTTELILRDYMTTGDAFLVPVPNLPDQFYILENRQRISPYDEVRFPGLYIYHLRFNGQFSKLDIQTADGKWDWKLDENKRVVKDKSNPISGNSHLEIVTINDAWYYPPQMEGNESDPFGMSTQTLYAPWTNPTTNGKFSGYQDYPTNVYMKLLEENNGVMKVKLSFNADVVGVEEPVLPISYKLSQNYPNPFNSSTKISYSISKSSFVSIKLYDLLGREIKTLVDEKRAPGSYLLDVNTSGLSGGVYFIKMQADDFSAVRKIVYLR